MFDHQMLEYSSIMNMMEGNMWKPHVEIAPNCPRCASPNTKFCYYNNYSLSQPRYFCKGCRRYWTKGGSLRNVPVGGGCRKNRRSRSSKSSTLSLSNRVGLNYLLDIDSPTRSSSDHSVVSCTGTDQGPAPEIDMADVFAKFLNQNNSPDEQNNQFAAGHEDSSSSSGSLETMPPTCNFNEDMINSSTHHQIENLMMMECQIPSGLTEEDIQEFVGGHPNFYELQELLEPQEEDMAWNKEDATLSWQQGFGQLVSYNDQVKMPTNFVEDDWSSMDLSSYGIFARP